MDDRMSEAASACAAFMPSMRSRRAGLQLLLGSGLGIAIAARLPTNASAGSRLADDNWRLCRKCRGLFLANQAGLCPKGGGHSATGSKNYEVEYGGDVQPGEEGGWRFCFKCNGLYWGGSGLGVCPFGGSHSENPNGFSYILEVNQSPALHEENGWHYCPKCHGLFFPKGKKRGKCPAGGAHKIYPHFDYTLTFIP